MVTVDLGKKLQSAKLDNKDDARVHLIKLQDLREELASMGKVVDDNEFASILLGSLPPSYEPTISAINAAADQTGTAVTSDRVIRLVTDEYDCCIIKKGKNKSGPEEAFATPSMRQKWPSLSSLSATLLEPAILSHLNTSPAKSKTKQEKSSAKSRPVQMASTKLNTHTLC
jgi:hypothetical protein